MKNIYLSSFFLAAVLAISSVDKKDKENSLIQKKLDKLNMQLKQIKMEIQDTTQQLNGKFINATDELEKKNVNQLEKKKDDMMVYIQEDYIKPQDQQSNQQNTQQNTQQNNQQTSQQNNQQTSQQNNQQTSQQTSQQTNQQSSQQNVQSTEIKVSSEVISTSSNSSQSQNDDKKYVINVSNSLKNDQSNAGVTYEGVMKKKNEIVGAPSQQTEMIINVENRIESELHPELLLDEGSVNNGNYVFVNNGKDETVIHFNQ